MFFLRQLVVFDMGSEKTYITEEAAGKLKLKPDHFQKLNIGQFSGTSVEKTTKAVTLKLKISDADTIEIKAYTIPKIATNCKNRLLPANFCKSEALKGLKYADERKLFSCFLCMMSLFNSYFEFNVWGGEVPPPREINERWGH